MSDQHSEKPKRCGCRVVWSGIDSNIIYCPTHEATFYLLEACKALLKAKANQDDSLYMDLWITAEDLAEAAIAKAEGKE